jgi:hypothetical protein
MNDQNATRAAGSSVPACSALISAIRCATDAAIHTTLLPRSEIGRILREEAAIIEAGREHDKTPNEAICVKPPTTLTPKAAGESALGPRVWSPEALPPTTDLRAFLMRLHRLAEYAKNIEWPDPIAAMNAVALLDILRDHMMRKPNTRPHAEARSPDSVPAGLKQPLESGPKEIKFPC